MGKRSQDDQKNGQDNLKASLKDFNIPQESWEQITHVRARWRNLIRKGADGYEAKRDRTKARRVQRLNQGIIIRVVIFTEN